MTTESQLPSDEQGAAWPFRTMLLMGTFGSKDPAGRRFHRQSWLALFFLVIGALVAKLVAMSWPAVNWLPSSVVGAWFVYVALRLWKYVSSLDELPRRLQLEAMALTYLTGFAICMFLGLFGLNFGFRINPMYFVALEPVRGAILVVLARRYR